MKKRFALLTVICAIMLFAVSCGPKNCKAEGCSEEIFEDGYCNEHYLEKAFEEGMEELGELFE